MGEPPITPRLRPVEAFPLAVDGREVVCLRDPSGLAEAVLTVPRSMAAILALFDGTRTLLDVQADIMRRYGELVPRSELETLVETLDGHLFLESPRLETERVRLATVFRQSPMRPAVHAGKAYAADAEALAGDLDAFFTHPEGPGPVGAPPPRGLRGL